MKLKKKIKRVVFNRKLLCAGIIFLLSATELYGGVLPFGLPAFAVWGNGFFGMMAYFAGVMVSAGNFLSILGHTAAFSLYVIYDRIFGKKLPDFLITGMAVMTGGIIPLVLIREGKAMYISYLILGILVSSAFTFIFKRSKEAVFDRLRGSGTSESDFAFLVITVMCVFLSFSNVETGRLSITATLMLLSGMVSSYKHKATVSVAINMAGGFFTMLFTPENVASVAYLTISGYTSSLIKKHGKFLVPLIYMAYFPLFFGLKLNITTFYLEDVVIASFIFLLIPARIMEFINIIPKAEKKEASCLKLSERVNMLSDTFNSMAELFAKMDMRTSEKKAEDAFELTVKDVCSDCIYKSGCKENAADMFKVLSGNKRTFFEKNIKCVRKRELLAAFSGYSRSMRLENVWQSHAKEENAAMANQMSGMAEMLRDICSKEETEIYRNEAAELEIVSALRKNGIKVKKIVAGRNGKGIFRVFFEMYPCTGKTLCDELIPEIIKSVIGFEVVRYGIKNCSACRVSYTEVPNFKVETALAAVSMEEISGDSSRFSYVDSEHFAVALSDGMGTGAKAKYKSSAATELAVRLLSLGMDLPSSVSMVNSLLLRQGENDFVTLDVARINLDTGEVEMSKNASASGYILRCGGRVCPVTAEGSPLGIMGEVETKVEKCRMAEGDFLIMVTDGVADCFAGEEERLVEKIGEFTLGSASELADYIMTEAMRVGGRKIKDDMTVITVGCIKKQKSGKDIKKGGSVYEKRQKSNYFR